VIHVNKWELLSWVRVPLLYYYAGAKQKEVEMCRRVEEAPLKKAYSR